MRKPEPGQLWRWSDDARWMQNLVGKEFMVLECRMSATGVGQEEPAVHILMGDRISWYYEHDVMRFAEIVNEAG